jgi:hypothetical protein
MGDDGGGSPSGRGLMFLACFVLLFFSFPYYHSFVRGARTPRPAHSALPRAGFWLALFCFSFPFFIHYSSVRGARTPRPAHSALPRAGFWLALFCFSFPFFIHYSSVRGARTPRPAHSALPRTEGFLCGSRPTEGRLLVFPMSFLGRIHIPWGWMAGDCRQRCHQPIRAFVYNFMSALTSKYERSYYVIPHVLIIPANQSRRV